MPEVSIDLDRVDDAYLIHAADAGQPLTIAGHRYVRDEPTEAIRSDAVNHPPHYTSHPSGVECITVVEHMGFNVGNAIKYLWRADEKGAPLEDLRKARWYVEREIARREASDREA